MRAENEGGRDDDEEEGTAPQQVPEQYASAAYSTRGVGGGRGGRVETVETVGRSLGLLAGGGRNEDIFRAITSFRTLTASSVRKACDSTICTVVPMFWFFQTKPFWHSPPNYFVNCVPRRTNSPFY